MLPVVLVAVVEIQHLDLSLQRSVEAVDLVARSRQPQLAVAVVVVH